MTGLLEKTSQSVQSNFCIGRYDFKHSCFEETIYSLISSKILLNLHSQNRKLIQRIMKNICEEQQKHSQAHAMLEKMRFSKQASIAQRNFSFCYV